LAAKVVGLNGKGFEFSFKPSTKKEKTKKIIIKKHKTNKKTKL
jgi:hypothetical protein